MSHLNAPNHILNNWLYDIWGYEQRPNGRPKRHLANGVFLDWATSNTTVKHNYIYNAGGEPIKAIMGNWNLDIAENHTSRDRVVPPFVDELGPEGTATHGIDLTTNRLTGSVVHYSDDSLVDISGTWQPVKKTGMWELFRFNLLEARTDTPAKITYTLPIPEDGTYEVSLLYLPYAANASNALVQVAHLDGTDEKKLNMKEGDKFGFAVRVGAYRFSHAGTARLTISNTGADGTVVANAVAFVKVDSH
jgi:hypothetical protein